MGRIKTRLIKRTARKLMQQGEEDYGNDFAANKKAVELKLEFQSKKLRNVLAGYVTKLKKRSKK